MECGLHRPKGGVMSKEDIKDNDVKDDIVDDDVSDDDTTEEDQQKDKELVKSLRTESIKNKKRAQKAEKELGKIRQDKLSDDEKKDLKIKQLEKDKEDADKKVIDSKVDSMILGYASTKGFQDLDVVKLIARKELDSEDEISEEDVKSVIDSIAKDKKYLLGGEETTPVGKGNFEGSSKPEKDKNADELLLDEFKKVTNI